MPACVSCWLYLLPDALENVISCETKGGATSQIFQRIETQIQPTGNAPWHNIPFIICLKLLKKPQKEYNLCQLY